MEELARMISELSNHSGREGYGILYLVVEEAWKHQPTTPRMLELCRQRDAGRRQTGPQNRVPRPGSGGGRHLGERDSPGRRRALFSPPDDGKAVTQGSGCRAGAPPAQPAEQRWRRRRQEGPHSLPCLSGRPGGAVWNSGLQGKAGGAAAVATAPHLPGEGPGRTACPRTQPGGGGAGAV